MNEIIRKAQTGEAGNAGEFGTHTRAEADIDLAAYVFAAAQARIAATEQLELSSAAMAARLIHKLNPEAVSFAPAIDDNGVDTWVAGMLIFDKDGKLIDDEITDDFEDTSYTDEEKAIRGAIVEYARCMGAGSENSWWAARFGDGTYNAEKAFTAKALAWTPGDEDGK